jgi:hypothetical protein
MAKKRSPEDAFDEAAQSHKERPIYGYCHEFYTLGACTKMNCPFAHGIRDELLQLKRIPCPQGNECPIRHRLLCKYAHEFTVGDVEDTLHLITNAGRRAHDSRVIAQKLRTQLYDTNKLVEQQHQQMAHMDGYITRLDNELNDTMHKNAELMGSYVSAMDDVKLLIVHCQQLKAENTRLQNQKQ